MALDLEEQEQLDEFKTWWKANGKTTMILVVAALAGYISWTGYQYFQHTKALEASDLYQNLVQMDASKLDEIKTQSAKLMENFSGTPYAGRAAIFAAKSNFNANDSKSAKSQLEWAIANAKEDSTRAIAGLQLASILTEEKNYEQALKILATIDDKGYVGLKDDLQGDIYLAQGKLTEAKKAYEAALTGLDVNGRMHQFTRLKLESLGG